MFENQVSLEEWLLSMYLENHGGSSRPVTCRQSQLQRDCCRRANADLLSVLTCAVKPLRSDLREPFRESLSLVSELGFQGPTMAKTQEAGFVNRMSQKFLAEEKESSERDVISTPGISLPLLSSFNLPVGSLVD